MDARQEAAAKQLANAVSEALASGLFGAASVTMARTSVGRQYANVAVFAFAPTEEIAKLTSNRAVTPGLMEDLSNIPPVSHAENPIGWLEEILARQP